MNNLEQNDYMIRKILIGLGISSNLLGFNYILESVKIVKKQQIHTNIVTIYEMLSKLVDNNKANIERSIRHAIIYAHKKNKLMQKIYINKPMNSSFIYDLAFNIDIFQKELEKMREEQ